MTKRNAVYFMWGPAPTRGLSLFGMPDGQEKRAEQHALPIRIFTGLGARVAPQRCPVLRAGLYILLYGHQKAIRILKKWDEGR